MLAIVVTSFVVGLPVVAQAAVSGGWRTVTYHGVSLRVPAAWKVLNLSRHPAACPRLNARVVYLGRPGPDPSCPAGAVGRAEAVWIRSADPASPDAIQATTATTIAGQAGRTDPISPSVDGNATLPHLAGANLRLNAGFLVALAAAAAVWWLLNKTTLGFELRTVGANPSAARSAGMSPERTWVIVMMIAGGLAGLAGASVILGTDFQLTPQIYGTYGIDAITVALLGRATPTGTVLAALLYGSLHAGGIQMQAQTQIPVDIVTVIQALIVLFVAAPPLVREIFHLRRRSAGEGGQLLAQGWGS